jgi:hypothetical protein
VLVAPLLALLGWSCGDGTGSELTDQSPCNTVYRGQCGAPCTLDGDCPNGLYCDFGECRADCTPDGAQCGAGACNDRGQCTNDGSGGTGGVTTFTTGVAGGGNGGACGAVTVDFAPQTPSVVLLIDQSGSMTTTFQGQARWDVVYDVLMDPVDGVVKQLEPFVRFGLALYTYHAGGQQCPELAELMPPALNNHSAIDGVYAPANPEAETPTGDSLVAVATQLAMFNEPGPKLIILATDGDPDRCENPDGHDAISKLEVTDAAQAAYAQNVETVIIAVGDAVSDQHQQDVANAGSGKPVPATFPCDPIVDPTTCAPTYEPNTKQEMIDAFLGIINSQRTCVFTLNGSVIAGKECDGDVKVNGVSIPCNDPDGWQLNSPTEIEFLGMTCDTIMNDPNVTITAEFPCDSIMEPPQ